jgi:Flp pilus assembly protein TadD
LNHGNVDRARDLYQKALSLDPGLVEASANLGVIEARNGRLSHAIHLWESAFDRAPGKSSIGMNLARVLCEQGKTEEAKNYVLRVLRFNPDLSEARKFSQELNASPPGCGP